MKEKILKLSNKVFEKIFFDDPKTWTDLYDICIKKCHKIYPTPSKRCHECPSLVFLMKKIQGKYYEENEKS